MKIIAFEGLDASGKATQTKMLVEGLRGRGFSVVSESFPRYEEPIGKLIQSWLKGEVNLTPEAAHMLYEADRQDFMQALEQYEDAGFDYLIIDRYTLSNLAFGMARGIDLGWLSSLQEQVRKPDTTIILDVAPYESFNRRPERRDRNETDAKLLHRSRGAYDFLSRNAADHPNLVLLDASGTKQDVHEAILELIDLGFA
ncbi:dTMP kinase [Paenibacillus xylanexedens]|uniref:dTMP kinase n=1 Tax=Paenibacillus xylanexedens TaxID=528191 RepID=UPI0016438BCF|nr:dTMP kinase [Paenibacillus xylanexedens]